MIDELGNLKSHIQEVINSYDIPIEVEIFWGEDDENHYLYNTEALNRYGIVDDKPTEPITFSI